MMAYKTMGGRFRAGIGMAVLACLPLLAACNAEDTLLEATDPDIIDPGATQSAEGALALYVGTLARLRTVTAGGESSWMFGGLLVDEWQTSSTFVQNDEADQRSVATNNSTVNGQFRALARARTDANNAIVALREFRPTETNRVAEMYFVRGFAEMQMASDFCNGIPLSGFDENGEIVYGDPKPVADIFAAAIASLDTAITLANGTDALSVSVNRAARIAKARAQQGNNLIAEAATTVAGIPTTFTYDVTFQITSGTNTLWSQGSSQGRYSVADSLEGNSRTILVRNALPFFSARDPRVPVSYSVSANGRDTTRGQDGQTFLRRTTLWGQLTATSVTHGLDARLIEAEAQLKAGNITGWLTTLNTLRATPPKLGEVQPAAMAPLTDPGTADARVNLMFREKAFWTFGRGHRLGDIRRLVRQYGRTVDNTYPQGQHYKGGVYGTAGTERITTTLPVPQAEQNNPNFTSCINNNP
jgi:hypothetical protein